MIEFSRLPIDHKIHIIIVSIIYLVIGIMETEVTVIDPPVDTLQSRGHLLRDFIQESIILVYIYPAGRDHLIRLVELEGMNDLHRLPLADINISILLVIPGIAHLPIHILLPAEISGSIDLVQNLGAVLLQESQRLFKNNPPDSEKTKYLIYYCHIVPLKSNLYSLILLRVDHLSHAVLSYLLLRRFLTGKDKLYSTLTGYILNLTAAEIKLLCKGVSESI